MSSSLALCARLGIFEGDTFEKRDQHSGLRNKSKAFVWAVQDDGTVEMSEMYSAARPERWTMSIGELQANWSLLEENLILRAKAGIAPKAPNEARTVAHA